MKKTFYIFLIIFLFFIIFQNIFAYNVKQDLEKIDNFFIIKFKNDLTLN